MPSYIGAFFMALVAAVVVTPGVIVLARKTGALDKPNSRKVHKKPVPRIGGLGIYISFMISMAAVMASGDIAEDVMFQLEGLMLSGTLIVILGLIDDYTDLPAKVKLVGQIIAACVLVIGFDVRIDFINNPIVDGEYIYLEMLAIPVAVFWVVGLTNTVNLIDGLDGLAESQRLLLLPSSSWHWNRTSSWSQS